MKVNNILLKISLLSNITALIAIITGLYTSPDYIGIAVFLFFISISFTASFGVIRNYSSINNNKINPVNL